MKKSTSCIVNTSVKNMPVSSFHIFLGKKKKSLKEHVDFIEKENEIFANNSMLFYITESCTDTFYDDIWKYKHSGYLHLNKIGLFSVLHLLFVYDSISSSFLWVADAACSCLLRNSQPERGIELPVSHPYLLLLNLWTYLLLLIVLKGLNERK